MHRHTVLPEDKTDMHPLLGLLFKHAQLSKHGPSKGSVSNNVMRQPVQFPRQVGKSWRADLLQDLLLCCEKWASSYNVNYSDEGSHHHRASIFVHKEEEEDSRPLNQASGNRTVMVVAEVLTINNHT